MRDSDSEDESESDADSSSSSVHFEKAPPFRVGFSLKFGGKYG